MKPLDFPYPDPSDWPSAAARYLLDKQEARLGAVAREALGIDYMPNADWWRLVFVLWRLGWRYRLGDGGAIVRRRTLTRGWPRPPANEEKNK